MKRFTVKIPCKNPSEAARVLWTAQFLKPEGERMTQTAISQIVGTSVQNVNEQKPHVEKALKAARKAFAH